MSKQTKKNYSHRPAAAILVVPKDSFRIVWGFSLPSAKNCHNQTESFAGNRECFGYLHAEVQSDSESYALDPCA